MSAAGARRTIRRFDPRAVTSIGEPEERPTRVGLRSDSVDQIWRAVVRLYETGLHPAIALSIRRRGRVVLDRAIGHANGNAPDDASGAPLVPATPHTPFVFFSASKMFTAMIVHRLAERGQVQLDAPVSRYISGFARRGKADITLRHLLIHRAGIPALAPRHINLETLTSPEAVVEVLCNAAPVSTPGGPLAYHALTAGYLLAEVVRRVTGQDVRALLREWIAEPLGLPTLGFGVSADQIPTVARNACTGAAPPAPVSTLFVRSLGVSFAKAIAWSNAPAFLTGVVPSANVIGSASDAVRFMELLLGGGQLNGVRLFERSTIAAATAPTTRRGEIDRSFLLPLRYGTGFMLGARSVSLYGPHMSRAFGHIGLTNTLLYADPVREISVALLTNGKPLLARGQLDWFWLVRTIARQTTAN